MNTYINYKISAWVTFRVGIQNVNKCTYVTVYSILIYKVAIVNRLHLHYMEYIFIQILNGEFLEYLLSLLLPSCHKSIKPSNF